MQENELITRKIVLIVGQDGKLTISTSNVPSLPPGTLVSEDRLPGLIKEGIAYSITPSAKGPSVLLG